MNTKSVENENPLYYNIETDNLILKDISADGYNNGTFENNYYKQAYITRPSSTSPTNDYGTLNTGGSYDESLFKNTLNWSVQVWTFKENTEPMLKWQN